MQIICDICQERFTWNRPKGYNGRSPKICGVVGKDGKWAPTVSCETERAHRAYLKWKAKQSYSTWKGDPEERPKLRKPNIKKDTPKQSKQWPCQNCGRLSNNRFNCPTCLSYLTNTIAGDECVYTDNGIGLGI